MKHLMPMNAFSKAIVTVPPLVSLGCIVHTFLKAIYDWRKTI